VWTTDFDAGGVLEIGPHEDFLFGKHAEHAEQKR